MSVHPTAIVEEGARLGDGCVVQAHAIIKRTAILGAGVTVHPFAVIGDEPQDLHFDRALDTGVRIGDGTVVREHVTIHRSTRPNTYTEIGGGCLLMVACHVGHDCHVGNGVMIANCTLLGGHVHIGDNAFLGGGCVIHQFCRVGESAMIGGGARISLSVPAFTLATERDGLIGLNLVGLRRRGFSSKAILELKKAFAAVYYSPGNLRDNARRALGEDTFCEPATRKFLASFAEGTRGFVRQRRTRKTRAGSELVTD